MQAHPAEWLTPAVSALIKAGVTGTKRRKAASGWPRDELGFFPHDRARETMSDCDCGGWLSGRWCAAERKRPIGQTREKPEKWFDLVGRIDSEAGKLRSNRRRKLGAVVRTRRGDDPPRIRPAIDDEPPRLCPADDRPLACSYRGKIDKARVYMKDALKRGKGLTGKIDLSHVGAGMLGDAMGEAACGKRIEAGRQWMEPSRGVMRVDMTAQETRTLAWLTEIGFHHVIEGGHVSSFQNRRRAHANAVGTQEGHATPIEGLEEDAYQNAAWYR